jgi:hypothetical protein
MSKAMQLEWRDLLEQREWLLDDLNEAMERGYAQAVANLRQDIEALDARLRALATGDRP